MVPMQRDDSIWGSDWTSFDPTSQRNPCINPVPRHFLLKKNDLLPGAITSFCWWWGWHNETMLRRFGEILVFESCPTLSLSAFLSVKGTQKCELNCRAVGYRFYVRQAEKVIDGTPCDQNGTSICVSGQCKVRRRHQPQSWKFPLPCDSHSFI